MNITTWRTRSEGLGTETCGMEQTMSMVGDLVPAYLHSMSCLASETWTTWAAPYSVAACHCCMFIGHPRCCYAINTSRASCKRIMPIMLEQIEWQERDVRCSWIKIRFSDDIMWTTVLQPMSVFSQSQPVAWCHLITNQPVSYIDLWLKLSAKSRVCVCVCLRVRVCGQVNWQLKASCLST